MNIRNIIKINTIIIKYIEDWKYKNKIKIKIKRLDYMNISMIFPETYPYNPVSYYQLKNLLKHYPNIMEPHLFQNLLLLNCYISTPLTNYSTIMQRLNKNSVAVD